MLSQHDAHVCSQNGEDGIIQHILKCVGETSRFCVEIGFGASESNTLNLVANKGWCGLWIDKSPEEVLKAKIQHMSRPLRIIEAELTVGNINVFLQGLPEPVDLLSIDVDGIDYYLWKAITAINPRIVVIEYNASFGPELSVTIPYREGFDRHKFHPIYHGASLKALTKLASQKGYKLVGVDGCGLNAFYVQKDLPMVEVSVEQAYLPHSKRHEVWSEITPKLQAEFGLMEV